MRWARFGAQEVKAVMTKVRKNVSVRTQMEKKNGEKSTWKMKRRGTEREVLGGNMKSFVGRKWHSND